MLIKYHEPYGDPNEKQDPLPRNWREIELNASFLPLNFDVVEDSRLYRSGIIWAKQIPILQEIFDIKHIISLVPGDWLESYYDSLDITIHQFPFFQRRELTFERVKGIVNVINSLDGPALVHCLKGATRTGQVIAGYEVINGLKTNKEALEDSQEYWKFGKLGMFFNFSYRREILAYER
jgi:protein tyrosine/serine phosphatase